MLYFYSMMLSIPINDKKLLLFLKNKYYGANQCYKLSHRHRLGIFIESMIVSKRKMVVPFFSGPNTFDVSVDGYANIYSNPCFLPKSNDRFNLYARNLFYECFLQFMDGYVASGKSSIISGIAAFVRKYNLEDSEIDIHSLRIYYYRKSTQAQKPYSDY